MNIKDELFAIARAFADANIDYAICGGFAVIIHGYPRFTRDIDFLVDERELTNIKTALYKIGYTVEAGFFPFDLGNPTKRKVFRISKFEGEDCLTIDLISNEKNRQPATGSCRYR